MFLIYGNGLNPNEILVLEKIFSKAGVIPFNVYLANKDLPEKEIAEKHFPVFVFDQTKTKPALIKKLEATYGKDFTEIEHIEIPRPNTFMKNEELKMDVWQKVKSLRTKVNVREVYFGKMNVPEEIISMLRDGGKREVYYMKYDNKTELELRPAEVKPTRENSLTYEEFAVFLEARYLLNFDKVDILSV